MAANSNDRRKIQDLEDRLEDLGVPSEKTEEPKPRPSTSKGVSQGMKMATDFVAAVAVGTFIGWALDWLFGTLPLFLIIFFVFGSAAGILNMMRTAKGMDKGLSGSYRDRVATTRPERPEERTDTRWEDDDDD